MNGGKSRWSGNTGLFQGSYFHAVECSRILLRVINAFCHIKDSQIPITFHLCEKALCHQVAEVWPLLNTVCLDAEGNRIYCIHQFTRH